MPAHASAQTGLAASGLIATEDAKLTSSDVTQDDVLGWSVAISGGTAVAGAPYDDAPLSDQGSVYVFVRGDTGWVQQAHLKAPDAARGDNFGWSVAVQGDTIAVGSPDDDLAHGNMGSVHVYARSGGAWTHQAKLTGSSGWVGDQFGSSVALDGESALVGAQSDDLDSGWNQGSAYVFTRSGTTWTEQAKLVPQGMADGAHVGFSVDLSADTAILGAPLGPSFDYTGAAYVFRRTGTTWTEESKLTASDGAPEDRFGYSVAVDGSRAIVGAVSDHGPPGFDNQGSAYAFVRDGDEWTEEAKLIPSDTAREDSFGWSVALDGDTAVVSAPGKDSPNPSQGAVYAFTFTNGWQEAARLTESGGGTNDSFGFSVALSGNQVLAGAPRGSAVVFTMRPADATPPQVDATPASAANGAGWYNHDVEVTWTASDASGTAPHPRESVASTEGRDVLYTSDEVCDAAGNCSTGTTRLSIDKTAPTVAATVEPVANAHGWHRGEVVVTFVCDDALSGVATCPAPVTLSQEAADQEVTGTAVDTAGNSSSVTLSGIDIDRSGPAITAEVATAPNANGWHASGPVVTFTCDDALSGIDACSPPMTITGEGADLSATGHAVDFAGNASSVTISGIRVDTTAALVTYTGNAGTYSADETIEIRCTATDQLSGISSATCADIRGPAYTFPTGTNSFTAEATDAAENRTVESIVFEVVVTPAAIGNVIDEIVSSPNAADQLAKSLAKLEAVQGDPKKEAQALASFEKDVDKEIGKTLTAVDAERLKALARAL